ncbi:hypothetical protein QAD02_018039 [Eretmocerus hayati]|uniref:Uncharacterized protein n=1 Tax=Eretmocerus hayati TaxID=131215 RepID=A0ACC2PFK4_9HYME|nr:hypothetical protein QAD02_018039 [Eretmocerus hayati]
MGKIIVAHFLVCLVALGVEASVPLKINQDIVLSSNDTNEIPEIFIDSVSKRNEPRYRLSNLVRPSSYKLDLTTWVGHPNYTQEEQSRFEGSVRIKFNTGESKKAVPLILHIQNLTVKSCELFGSENPPDCIRSKPGDDNYEEGFFTIEKNLEPGTDYTLIVNFKGSLSTDMQGFYRSSYKDKKGNPVLVAATQFEPTHARRAFPCFDEPEMKARFDVSITHYKDYSVLFNTRKIKTSKLSETMDTTTFETTPLMSTYLLAFVVSDFQKTESDNFTSIWSRRDAVETAEYAAKTSAKLLKALDEYTGINFKKYMQKMDHAAIPDFKAGAMENWGLITYREKSLLYDNQIASTAEKQNIIETIAHELAHQWFGDLVTLKWWDYIWLNEGFATFFQSYITEEVEPEWRSVEQSVVKSIQTTAFDFDSGNGSHPLNLAVNTPKEISDKFDTISYQKGGAVIRMMQHFLGDEILREGLQAYLNDRKLNSADSDDLLKSLQQVATAKKISLPQSMSEIMDAWVKKPGYPVINVRRENGSQSVKIEQHRFFTLNSSEVKEEDKNIIWSIPINYATPSKMNFNDTKPDTWLTGAIGEIKIDIGDDDWIIMNKQQAGYYRVAYDERNWKLIANYLNSENDTWKNIDSLTRAQLINDAFAFAKLDQLSLPILLDLTKHLKNETDHIAWYPAYKVIAWMDEKLMNTEFYKEFKEYFLGNLKTVVESVGLVEPDKEGDFAKLTRIPALKWACHFGYPNCSNNMHEKLVGWLDGSKNTKVSADLREITLCYGMRQATKETWDKAYNKSLKGNKDDQETKHLISALACSADASILKNYLTLATHPNATYDFLTVLKDVSHNSPIGVQVSLDFLTQETLSVAIKLGEKLSEAFNTVAERITNTKQLAQMQDATKQNNKNPIPSRIIDKAAAMASKNVVWYERNGGTLSEWAKTLHPKDNTTGGTGTISSITMLIVSILALVLNLS